MNEIDNHIKLTSSALNENYVKFSCGNYQRILDTLTPNECKIIMLLSSYVSYKDCVLRKGGNILGHALSIRELSDLLESKYDTFRRILYSLRDKDVLYIENKRDDAKIIMNPYILSKGSNISSEVLDLFNNTDWSKTESDIIDINTDFSNLFRNLILDWKKESMEFCNYKCIITGEKISDIHHPYSFRKIIVETFDKLNIPLYSSPKDYDDLMLSNIKNTFLDIHNSYGIGMGLCRKVHGLFHNIYGYTEFKYRDFVLFVDDVIRGEYNEFFKDNDLQICINKQAVIYLKSIEALINKNKEHSNAI